jgi:glycosyltransferase involved in cell wall biosynthesis
MQNLTVLHVAALNFKQSVGLTTSVPSLVSAQNKLDNVKAGLVLSRGENPENWHPDFPVYEFKKDFIQKSFEDLPIPFNNPDLVVFHSTYIPIHARFTKQLSKRQIPYIIVPRGGMTKKSQNIKPFKKLIGNKLFFNKMVKDSLAIHCLTEGEDDESKYWGKNSFIVGNGISIPKSYERNKFKIKGKTLFTFIGRLDIYHKGLDLLIEGCYLVKDVLEKNNGIVNIYGPDKKGNKDKLQDMINEKKLEHIIKINDPVYGTEKHNILKSTDVFVHTSRFEGHPMSVLEALSFGVPCLLTPGTNMSEEVMMAGAGWQTELSPESIASGLKEVILTNEELVKMSMKSLQLAEKYSWDNIARKTIEVYNDLINTVK